MAHWLAAYKNKLKSGYLPLINITRKKADLALYYSLYFKLLGRKIAEYNIQPENTYNMDEKGFLIGFLIKSRRIFSKKAFNKGRIKNISQDSNREWITIIGTIYANGISLSPGLIY